MSKDGEGTRASVPLEGDADTDVIVLGVGTSGEDVSGQLLDAGLDVVGIEDALMGGECPYPACLPSKIMTRAAKALREARRVNGVAGEARDDAGVVLMTAQGEYLEGHRGPAKHEQHSPDPQWLPSPELDQRPEDESGRRGGASLWC